MFVVTLLSSRCGSVWFLANSYQDLQDLEDSVKECCSESNPLELFDTSCFSGQYVTGENIEDQYFAHLHARRNDKAKQERSSGDRKRPLPQQSNDGCESVSNDKREGATRDGACESITNDGRTTTLQ